MSLKNRLVKLEQSMETLRYQQRGIAIIGCGNSCRRSRDDDFCEHEQQRLDEWIAEHGGREPDEIIRIVGVPGNAGQAGGSFTD